MLQTAIFTKGKMDMNKYKPLKYTVILIAFLCLLWVGLSYVTWVVRDKSLTNVWEIFRHQKKNSVDVVFLGTSHQFCSINADILAEEYGIDGFMLATSGQTMPMSYYAAMEAIKLQHPKKIVFEVLYCCHDFRTLTDGMTHAFFDGMPFGTVKKQAVEDLIPEEDRIYYYLDLGYFHNRWKELEKEDFVVDLNSKRGTYHFEEVNPAFPYDVVDREERIPIPENTLEYLDKLMALCDREKVELVFYIAPFGKLHEEDDINSVYDLMRKINWIEQYTTEKGYSFHNLFYEKDEIGLDNSSDFMDGQHFNCYGQEKFTRYMAEKGYFD